MADESHYARAKYLVGRKDKRVGPRIPGGQLRDATDKEVAQAQVHATLALVDVMRELLAELAAVRQRDLGSQVRILTWSGWRESNSHCQQLP